jgi:hypothetical protein
MERANRLSCYLCDLLSPEDTLEGRLLDLLLELNALRANWPSDARATGEVKEVLRNCDLSGVNRAIDLHEED